MDAFTRGFIKRAEQHGLTEKQAVNLMPILKGFGNLMRKATIPAAAAGAGLGAGVGYGASNVGNKLYDEIVFKNRLPEKINSSVENLQRASEQIAGTPADAVHNLEAQPGLIERADQGLQDFSKFVSNPWVKYPTIASGITLAAYPAIAAYNSHKEHQRKVKHDLVLSKLLNRLK